MDSKEFWSIVEASFPEAQQQDNTTKLQAPVEDQPTDQQQKGNETIAKILLASNDPRIADYWLHGVGTEEGLIVALERGYDLTESEAISAIDCGLGKLGDEVAGYDEA
jgi:hypothetical protein